MEAQQSQEDLIIKWWPWLEANRKGLLVALVAVALFIGGISFWSSSKAAAEVSGGTALSALLASPATTPDTLLAFATSHAGTQAGARAELQAGLALYQAAKYADALPVFEKFTQEHSGDALANQALFGLAACQEALGKLDLAASAYARVANSSVGDGSSAVAKYALGRISEQQGKLTEAQNYFQTVCQSVNNQLSLFQDARRHLDKVQQQLALTAKPAAK